MAAAPVKSPLHNFPLTFLKWGSKKDQQRCRRSPFDTPLSPPPQPSSSDAEPSNSKGSRSSRNRRNNNHHHHPPTPPPSTTAQDDEEERDCGKKPEVVEEGVSVNEVEGDGEKGWNLRPRRAAAMKGIAATNSTAANTNSSAAAASAATTAVGETAGDNLPKSMRLRGLETQGNGGAHGGGGSERRGIKRFWISLSNKEIEEDIYSMTGSKPSRRPKKRPKNVQKQLDNVFPGLWMVGFSPEYYRCLDVPPKR